MIGLVTLNGTFAIKKWTIGHHNPDSIVEEKKVISYFQLITDSAENSYKNFLCVYAVGPVVFVKNIETKVDFFSLPFFSQKEVKFKAIQARNLLLSYSDTNERSGIVDIWEMGKLSHSSPPSSRPRLIQTLKCKNKTPLELPRLTQHLASYQVQLDQLPYLMSPSKNYLFLYFSLSNLNFPSFYFCIWNKTKDKLHCEFLGNNSSHSENGSLSSNLNKLTNKKLSKSLKKTFNLNNDFPLDHPLIAFNDRHLAIAIGSQWVIWDFTTKNTIKIFQCQHTINNILLININQYERFLFCEESGIIHLRNIFTKKTTPFIGHNQKIVNATFSNNGLYLASTSQDKTLRVWL